MTDPHIYDWIITEAFYSFLTVYRYLGGGIVLPLTVLVYEQDIVTRFQATWVGANTSDLYITSQQSPKTLK